MQKAHRRSLGKVQAATGGLRGLVLRPAVSSQREQEHAVGMATCLRPSTRVYSLRLRRFLSAMEHLMLQGIFPTDFAHPEVVEMLAQKATMAKDMAGNAFSTTVLQANLLALLVNSAAWRVIRVRNEGPPSSPGTKRGAEELEPDTEQTPPPKNALFTRAVPVPGGLGFVQMKWRGWNRKSAT
ncbi:unnamed protein product, partial [Symbiodinium microadriaticum]